MIDVIIPVYRGLDATRRCLTSVLAAGCAEPHEVIVIDDESPEPEISSWLRALAGEGRIRLVAHPNNLGFVASVNEGMSLHEERDVVLLNSDTEVPKGWLDRLARCAREEPQVATVTPFSNNATICSYPRFAQANALPEGLDTPALDGFFREQNRGHVIDIPTAVGFCMFITRRALRELGGFDANAFGRGYGEEVDFCMRASRAGFRHLLCADLFVHHEGEVSFGTAGASIRQRAQAIVDQRYPEFQTAVRDFIERDPARTCRRRVDMARLAASKLPRLLVVTHAWGGGVEKHVTDLAQLLANDREVLLLRPHDEVSVNLRWTRLHEEFSAWFDSGTQWERCIEVLRGVGVGRVHFHHVHGLPQSVLELPRALGVAYDVTLHDHFPICARYHLSPDGLRACDAAASGACGRCLEQAPGQWGVSIDQWRTLFRHLLLGAERVIVPSRDTGERIHRFFPEVNALEWPHPEAARTTPALFKVALLGGLSPLKGSRVLEACVRDAQARGLPLHFRVLGHVDRPMPVWPQAPLSISGSYPEDRLDELIAVERPDAFLFLSRVPETYSYTLSAAMRTGLPVIATRFGAFPERLHGYRRHVLVDVDASPAAVNDALVDCLSAAARGALAAAR